MSRAVRQQKTFVSSGFARVSLRRPCLICGKFDWCSFTRDEMISIYMRVSAGAIKMNSRGGFIHAYYDRAPAIDFDVQRPQSEIKPSAALVPLEVRDAVDSELIRLSPAMNYDRELVSGSKGLLARGFLQKEVVKFGALPLEMSDRDKLSYKLNRFVRKTFLPSPRASEMSRWSASQDSGKSRADEYGCGRK
jgi:hypothetical protein